MMAQLPINFQGRSEVEICSWARVQAMRNGIQLALRGARQVCALGQVLAQQAIRILVGAALPGAAVSTNANGVTSCNIILGWCSI